MCIACILKQSLLCSCFSTAPLPLLDAMAFSAEAQWYEDYCPDDVYKQLTDRIVAEGLPCRLELSDSGDFVRADLHPLPGWIDVASPVALARQRANGWNYHVSFCYADTLEDAECAAAWQRLRETWDGQEVVLAIDWFVGGAQPMLANHGLGGDPDALLLYSRGCYGYKYEQGHGLHISM